VPRDTAVRRDALRCIQFLLVPLPIPKTQRIGLESALTRYGEHRGRVEAAAEQYHTAARRCCFLT